MTAASDAPTVAAMPAGVLFWTLDRVAAALSECVSVPPPVGARSIRGICTDTRHLVPGDCFVALVGERYDAHDLLGAAVAAGAAAVVVQRPPRLTSLAVPVFLVHDTLIALGALARYWRTAWGKPVVAVAGSNGKTTTKELVRAALGETYRVHATYGNLNNRVGVPLTLLATPPEAECAVVEIGTNLPGEVAALRAVAIPDVAVVTCVTEEHLEGLGDLAGVLREESAIFDGVALAITPSDQPDVAAAARRGARRVVQAGLETGEVRADAWSIAADGQGTIVFDGVPIHPPVRGAHNLRNAMLALAVARVFGVDAAAAGRGIGRMPVPPMRAAWQHIGRATVLNDAYNANPGSMGAALAMLDATAAIQRVAVLGTMRELGVHAARYHDDVARAALASSADIVAGIGDFHDALRRVGAGDPRVVTARDVDDLWPLLASRLVPDATILLKASRGVALERLLPYITSWATP